MKKCYMNLFGLNFGQNFLKFFEFGLIFKHRANRHDSKFS